MAAHCYQMTQRVCRPLMGITYQQNRTFLYTKERVFNRDTIAKMQQEIDLSPDALKRHLFKKQMILLKEHHKYIAERHLVLGPDLASATFVIARGGAAKFVDTERWYQLDNDKKVPLPDRNHPAFKLEGLDCTNTTMMYESLDNFVNLYHLRYLNLSKCELMTDWCMDKLQIVGGTLEHLDLSGCPEITDNGLAALHKLRKLRYVNISSMPKVREKELISLMLEDALPGCFVENSDITPDNLEKIEQGTAESPSLT